MTGLAKLRHGNSNGDRNTGGNTNFKSRSTPRDIGWNSNNSGENRSTTNAKDTAKPKTVTCGYTSCI